MPKTNNVSKDVVSVVSTVTNLVVVSVWSIKKNTKKIKNRKNDYKKKYLMEYVIIAGKKAFE